MTLTDEYISTLPVITDEQEEDFYADGEFEAAVLADFDKEADIIDAQNANQS